MDKEMKKSLMKDFIDGYNKKKMVQVGHIFEMFGCKYKVCSECICDRCAFNDSRCDLNVDIPSCANGVHFEVVNGNKKFNVVLTSDYEIEAPTEKEAIDIAKQKMFRGEIKNLNLGGVILVSD